MKMYIAPYAIVGNFLKSQLNFIMLACQIKLIHYNYHYRY